MTFVDVNYKPGTQKSPQQTEISEPSFTDTDHVHFPDGRLQTLPPYSVASVVEDYVSFEGYVSAIHTIKITGTNVGTYSLLGSHQYLYVIKNSNLYNITPLQTSATATLGSNPIATTNTSGEIVVTYNSHGLTVGDRIKLSGATDVGGISAATYINKEHIVIDTPTANTFTVDVGFDATSTTTGGGASVQIFKQIAAGNFEQDAATGYGVGLYGEGIYGSGGPSVNAQQFPRIWSFGNFGNEVVMCPGDYTTGDGQKIYIWDGDITVAPSVLTNAPTDCNWVGVVNNSVVALCGDTVKISEQGDGTVWTGITTYSKPLERVWKLISLHTFNEKAAVIFTPSEAILLRYVGGGEIWDLSDLFTDDGIVAPYAATMLDSMLFWYGYRGAYMYNGSPPVKVENSQNDDYIIETTDFGKNWKSFCYPDPQNHEWYYHYTSESSADSNPDVYKIHNIKDNSHTLGTMSRTAAQRPGMIDSTFYIVNAPTPNVTATLYRHFTNGAVTFDWYATTSEAYIFDAEARGMVDQFFPDSNMSGNANLALNTREYAQGTLFTTSDYTITPTTAYLSTKAAGKLVSLTISGSSFLSMGAWKMNIRKLGRRN